MSGRHDLHGIVRIMAPKEPTDSSSQKDQLLKGLRKDQTTIHLT